MYFVNNECLCFNGCDTTTVYGRKKKIKNNEITQTKLNVSEFDSILATFSRYTFVRNY